MLTAADIEAKRQRVRELRRSVASLEQDVASLERNHGRRAGATRNCAAILLYHRVAALDPERPRGSVTPETFRQHMEHVARTCVPMSVGALANAAASGDIPARTVAITIDDVYLDAMTASDILLELRLPVTMYANSNAGGETFRDIVDRVLLGSDPIPAELAVSTSLVTLKMPTRDTAERRAAADALAEIGWTAGAEQRRDLISALRRWHDVDVIPRSTHRMVSAAELRELASRPGHDIGSHSVNHLSLPAHSVSVKEQEIEDNRRYLEDIIRAPVSSFAYPYGDVDDDTVRICRRAGFHTAVTVENSPVRPWHDALRLPRQEIEEQPLGQFTALLDHLLC
jgi:peptidoglycan/xylan/chitin deacetylase (PgdA/CDA1 family)